MLRNTSKLKSLKIGVFGFSPQILRVWKSVEDSLPNFYPKFRPIWASILISLLLTKDVGIWGSQVDHRVLDPTSHFVWTLGFCLLSPDLAS